MLPEEVPVYSIQEFAPKRTKYCVVIHIWNEGDRIRNQLKRMKAKAHEADIIIADGESTDGSTEPSFLKSMGVRTLVSTAEHGLGTAIRMGLHYALKQGYEGVITVDGNGKDGVEAVTEFIEHLDQGYDFVQGSRYMKGGVHKNTPLERHLGLRFVVSPFFFLTTGKYFTDVTNGFRAMSTKFLTDPGLQPFRETFVRFNLQFYFVYRAPKLKMKITEIPVVRTYPDDGSIPSKITNLKTKFLLVGQMLKAGLGGYNPK